MEHADPKLGSGLWRAGNYVRGSAAGLRFPIASKTGRRTLPALDIPSGMDYKLTNCRTTGTADHLGCLAKIISQEILFTEILSHTQIDFKQMVFYFGPILLF